ncbi:MAG: hypothetical protein M3Z31_14320, partial [Pseudomonadota bacterium]|nr:hypothetical protein [Pseudomonadota bacterium]
AARRRSTFKLNRLVAVLPEAWAGIVLTVSAPKGVLIAMRNRHPLADPQSTAWKLPDLPFDSEVWAYFKLIVPNVFLVDAMARLPVTFSVDGLGGGRRVLQRRADLPPLRRTSRADLMTMAPEPLVESRREELAAVDTLEIVRRLIAHGHWAAAAIAVSQAQRRFRGRESCRGILEAMRRMIARPDRMVPAESAGASLLPVFRGGARGASHGTPDHLGAPAFLRRMVDQVKERARH